MDQSNPRVSLADIEATRPLLDCYLRRTPLVSSEQLGDLCGVRLHFKAEMFQKTGSFKPRGMLNSLHYLDEDAKGRGVVTMSAGNAAQALAFASAQLGIAATVVMPQGASRSKAAATEGYGARVLLHGGMHDLLPKVQQLQRDEGLTFVHPFDDLNLIAGHGTLGLELLEEIPAPDVVIVPVGGGGLLSGVAAALKQVRPATRVIGVEPEGAAAMTRSLETGQPERIEDVQTLADGLAAPFAGEHTLRHVQHFVDEIVLVRDDEIRDSLRLILERCKLLAEPAAAASFAALLHGAVQVTPGSQVVCVLSGGNVDRSLLKTLL
ncbi:MAG: threonine/serine dehydratase [Anaerolineaceae bacterium]|nr:threonine/serine dehydratase [Anaerolineaceae bacterium]